MGQEATPAEARPYPEPVRWTQGWLSAAPGTSSARNRYPGERLGLPAQGPGAVASTGRRCAALLVDIVLAGLVAGLFTAPELPRNWSLLAWAILTVLPTAIFGVTPGMAALGMRVARVDGTVFVGVPRALLRTALLFLIVPAVVWDSDGRGLHDRAVGTVVVRTR